MEAPDVGSTVDSALQKAVRERGHANVLVAGRTGSGERTLIDSTFQDRFASTARGQPVAPTRRTSQMRKEGVPLSVYDTRGVEQEDLDALGAFIDERAAQGDERQRIHVAWVVLPEDVRRIEDRDAEITAMLAKRMPVVVVLSKARPEGKGFESEVRRRLPKAKKVTRVRALPERLPDGRELEPMGLAELVEQTADLIPEGERRAFVAAQTTSLALKVRKSHMVVAAAAMSTAGVAMTPIPVADAALMVPILVGMLAGITVTFGLSLGEGFLRTVAASTVGGAAAAFTVNAAVGEAMKLVPDAGTVAGGAVAATTAATLTTTFGEAYISVLERLVREKAGEPPTADEVVAGMQHALGR
jgi:uncharacterized protein (DUF697 family)/predicted GTPase